MAERPSMQVWVARGIYVLLAIAIIYIQLLPLDTVPSTFVMPDVLLALTLVWAARRPDYVPILLIAVVFFATDLLFQRPPGLWTALVLILTETLRARAQNLRGLTLPLEWTSVALGIVAVYGAYRFTGAMTLLPQPPLLPYLIQMVMTILAYPVLAGLSWLLFGISRPAPGAVDVFGERL